MDVKYSDTELINQIRSGDKQTCDAALKYLYKEHYPPIKSFLVKNNGKDEDAADIFQEAIIVLYHKIKEESFRGDSTIKTFLYSITRNLWFKELRGQPVDVTDYVHLERLGDSEIEEINQVERDLKGQVVRELLNKMGDGCRGILIDYYYAKHSMKEIMIKLGLGSEQAAKNKKYRCMQRLMELCKKNGVTKD